MSLKIENTHGWGPERMALVWPSVLACIRRLVDEFPDEVSENETVSDVMCGRRQLWVVYDEDQPEAALLAVLTERKQLTPTKAMFIEIVGIGGERINEALPLISEIEAWGRKNGAQKSTIIGRKGWLRLLKPYGYREKAVILIKTLGDEADGLEHAA